MWVGSARWVVVAVGAMLVAAASAAGAQPVTANTIARFATPTQVPPLQFGPDVLSEQERSFVATLPELRVAIPLPAVRPYEVVGDDGLVTGIHPDILGYLARGFGLRVKPVLQPSFADALNAVRERRADMIMTIGYTAERAHYLEYTLGITPLPGALFARRDHAGAAPPLAQASFAVERSFAVADYLRRQYPNAQIVPVETTGDALRAVNERRADYYLGGLLTTMDWLGREPGLALQIDRLFNYSSGYYHFAVRKDLAPLAGVLNKGISSLRASGGTDAATNPAMNAAIASAPAGLARAAPLALNAAELAALARQPVWKIGAIRRLPLLNNIEPSGQHSGIAAEFSEQVAQRIGVGLHVMPFDNVGDAMDALRRGEIDLIPLLTRTPERATEFAFSQPYVAMPYVIVARSDAPLYWSLDSLRGKVLALPAQHALRPLLAQKHPQIQILTVADGNAAMDAVADGRADAAVEVKLFANLRIHADGSDRLRTVAQVDEIPADFHFAGRPAAQPLLALVDRALADIPPAEKLRMQRRWISVDLDPPFPWRRHAPWLAVAALALIAGAAGSAWWMRRLAAEVEARRRSEARLRDIATTLPCVAFRHIVDVHGQVLAGWVSPGAQTLLGIAGREGIEGEHHLTLIGQLSQHLAPAEAQRLTALEQRGMQQGDRLHASVTYPHPDGRARQLACEAVRTPAENGAWAWTGVVVDVSREHQLQQRVMAQAQERNLMLASASHELRAPAHTLALALQALQAQHPAPQQVAPLRIAQDAVDTLSQLLADVLDAARLDGAPLQLLPQPLALRPLLQGVAEGARITAQAKGLQFEVEIDLDVPETLVQDPLRLKQVLTNLLSNAVKYTARGRVRLSVRRAVGSDGNAELHFSVLDTGPGIDAETRARVFTPYATAAERDGGAPASETRTARSLQSSVGLGLSICQRLATLMRGGLRLDSKPGHGTTVTLVLPCPVVAPTPAAPGADAPRGGAVLVCDDDSTSRLLLAFLLRGAGYEVEEFEDGHAVLQRSRGGDVAAVITDLQMPGMDGATLLRALRAQPGPRPLLVVCSGDSASDDEPSAGLADARLMKPVDVAQLSQVLRTHGVLPQALTPAG